MLKELGLVRMDNSLEDKIPQLHLYNPFLINQYET